MKLINSYMEVQVAFNNMLLVPNVFFKALHRVAALDSKLLILFQRKQEASLIIRRLRPI